MRERIDARKALLLLAAICKFVAEEMMEQPAPVRQQVRRKQPARVKAVRAA